jgi:CHAT domain-containing protein
MVEALPTAGVGEVQPLLDAETTILSFLLGDQRSYLFLIDRRGLAISLLPPRSTLETVAVDLYSALASAPDVLSRDQIPQMARRLGELLLDPVAARLRERIIVVKDGALHRVPFGVLRLSSRPERPLVLDHVVTAVPSLSVLAQLHRPNTRRPVASRFAVLAPDAGGSPRTAGRQFPRLEGIGPEVAAIAKWVPKGKLVQILGTEATPARLATVSRESIGTLHLATHAFVFDPFPELSAIVLADGQGGDALLRLHDIFGLDIPVDLVVLSACETALGDLLRGEGMVSMAHAFLGAGAARALVSLWRIDDASTATLMAELYRVLNEEALDPAAALRRAQLRLLSRDRQDPHYWAAFEIQGR